MGKLDSIVSHARNLVPPDAGEDPRHWRINVFLTLMALVGVTTFHITAVNGWLEPIGIAGAPSAVEVEQLQDTGKQILKAIYSPQIRQKIRERCDTNDATERERINVELARLYNEYEQAAGIAFTPVPTCSEV